MTQPEDNQGQKRQKKIALFLAALLLVMLVVTAIWWNNLADSDIEDGPVGPLEAITDSADDEGRKPLAD